MGFCRKLNANPAPRMQELLQRKYNGPRFEEVWKHREATLIKVAV
jgi:hypothetical protein